MEEERGNEGWEEEQEERRVSSLAGSRKRDKGSKRKQLTIYLRVQVLFSSIII